jgi:hypothetical protein
MGYKRVDPLHVADDAGNVLWLPELSSAQHEAAAGNYRGPDITSSADWPVGPEQSVVEDALKALRAQYAQPGTPPDANDADTWLMEPGTENPVVPPGFNPGPPPAGTDQPDPIVAAMGALPPQLSGNQPPAGPSAPEGPHRPGMPEIPLPPLTVQEAEDNERDAANEAFSLAHRSMDEQQAAAEIQAQRKVDAAEAGVRDWDNTQAQNQKAIELANKTADQQTADWLREMQIASSAKADPSRYFHDSSSFRQVAWMVALITGAI